MLAAEPGLLEDVYVRAAVGSPDAEPAPPGGPFRWEPLLYAAHARLPGRSTLPAIEVLLAAGADPNAGYLWDGGSVFTAVTGVLGGGEDWPNWPAHPEWSAAARLLLDAGADPNDLQSVYNRMFLPDDAPYELLFAHGLGRDVRPGPWPARLGPRAWPKEDALALALHWAAEHGFTSRVRLFLANGVDPNGDPHHANVPTSVVEAAQRAGNREIVDLLVAGGATPVELDPAERFAAACLAGDRVAAEAVRTDELVEAVGLLGLLAHAAKLGKVDAVRLLLDLGADVDAFAGATALHWAAWWGHLDVVRVLVERGADLTIEDDEFHGTPLGWAEHAGQSAVAEYLRFAVTPPS
jgi:ankyrin repeat protein